jgi:hypothetical protein
MFQTIITHIEPWFGWAKQMCLISGLKFFNIEARFSITNFKISYGKLKFLSAMEFTRCNRPNLSRYVHKAGNEATYHYMVLKWDKAYEVLHIVELCTRNKGPLNSFHGKG